MLKALTQSTLFRVLSLMAKREVEFKNEQVGQPISYGIWEAMDNPRPITDTEVEYQQEIQRMDEAARIELKSLILLGRDHHSFDLSNWQDHLQHAATHGGEKDPHKNWLWGRCASFPHLAKGCSYLLCREN